MAATPQWRIDRYLDKFFTNENEPTIFKVVDVSDRNFCLVQDPSGKTRNVPWVQMDSGYYQPYDPQ